MYFSDRITLRTETTTQDSDGYSTVATTTDVDVWADVLSVTRTEFYAANANGINAAIEFDVHAEDYANQRKVVYNSQVYEVIRTYAKGLGKIAIICSDKAVPRG